MSSSSLKQETPALFTRISILPNDAYACARPSGRFSGRSRRRKSSRISRVCRSSASASAAFAASRHKMAMFAAALRHGVAIPKPSPGCPRDQRVLAHEIKRILMLLMEGIMTIFLSVL
jgi:hypothetical protein